MITKCATTQWTNVEISMSGVLLSSVKEKHGNASNVRTSFSKSNKQQIMDKTCNALCKTRKINRVSKQQN
jgi:hypothetical protein